MEKQIFKVELLDLLDLDDDEKEELYNDSFENNCMLIKLTKKLRNLQKYPISDISRLHVITKKIDFKDMYEIYLEF
jgi:hypothetical protein